MISISKLLALSSIFLGAATHANEPCSVKLFPATPCLQDRCNPSEIYYVADVSLLAWQGIVGGLDFALKNNPLPIQAATNINGKLIAPDFGWSPALKINLGMQFSSVGWDLQFRWTYFHSDSSKNTKAPQGIFPLWVTPAADMASQFVYGSAKAKHELNFNGIDIEMAYHPFLTPGLSGKFIAGVKVAQIHQEFDLHYSDGFSDGVTQLLSAKTEITNTTVGAGPRLGFSTEWHLPSGFSIIGSLAGSLPLWHVRVYRDETDENIQNQISKNIDTSYKNRFWIFRSVLETSLGIQWITCLRCTYPFGINASYELQYYSEQNMMSMLVNPGLMSQTYMPRGDLIFHGTTLTFHFGF